MSPSISGLFGVFFGVRARKFMSIALRKWRKPLCISQAMARPRARSLASSGQSRAAGWSSATYSQIAKDSWMLSEPSTKIGTWPAPENDRIRSFSPPRF